MKGDGEHILGMEKRANGKITNWVTNLNLGGGFQYFLFFIPYLGK